MNSSMTLETKVKKQKGYTAIVVLYILIVLVGGVGWVMNIIDIVNSDFSKITGMLVLRIIGVFLAPLGAVLGYF